MTMPNTRYMAQALRRDVERSFGRKPKHLDARDQRGSAPTPNPNAAFLDWAAGLDDNQLRYALAALGGELGRRSK